MTEQEKFVIEWLKREQNADALCVEFHNTFHAIFGGKRNPVIYGASLVFKAQRLLSSMYERGLLVRCVVSLPEHISGFPNWVYSYSLPRYTAPPNQSLEPT